MEKLDQQIQTAIQEIQQQVGNEKVLVLVSGGVDSAVSAALLLKAIPPERVYAIHVDHGLMRLNESDQICDAMKSLGLIHLKRMDAQNFFFNSTIDSPEGPIGPLTTLNDPEKRRIVIGTLFIKLIEHIAAEMGLDFSKTFWAQGTIKPDLLETANPDYTANKSRIKTHHNDVDIVREARELGLVVETNKLWFKDEVRQVALRLGIPEEIAYRQPFPGPGLGVRFIGFDGTETVSEEQKGAIKDVLNELALHKNLHGDVIPIKTVGVHGEQRTYRYFALFSGSDFEPDWTEMEKLASIFPKRLDFINRVVYRLNPNREGEGAENYVCRPEKMTRENIELLRQIDARVSKVFAENRKIAQAFAVLMPLGKGDRPYTAVIRAVVTQDFMTARPARLGEEINAVSLRNLVSEIIRDFPQIECVGYDFTPKPPATVEWM